MRGSSRKRISNSIGDWNRLRKVRKSIKLVRVDSPKVIQGLVSFQDAGDHIFVWLVENAKFNQSKHKKYAGVAGNLFAFACKTSVERGYKGSVAFDSKTRLIEHYKKTLRAHHAFGLRLILDEDVAQKLIFQYFDPLK